MRDMGPSPPCGDGQIDVEGRMPSMRSSTHNCGLSSNANTRADRMGDGSPPCVVELLVHFAQPGAGPNCRFPGHIVHAEVPKVGHINDNGAVDATETVVSGH
jgi:hypothetical protein